MYHYNVAPVHFVVLQRFKFTQSLVANFLNFKAILFRYKFLVKTCFVQLKLKFYVLLQISWQIVRQRILVGFNSIT